MSCGQASTSVVDQHVTKWRLSGAIHKMELSTGLLHFFHIARSSAKQRT